MHGLAGEPADTAIAIMALGVELEELRRELSRVRSELAAVTPAASGRRAAPRRGLRRSWVGGPLLGAAVLVLSAQAASPDIEKRLSALERLVRKTGDGATQVSAPFDVVGPGGDLIMRVSSGAPSRAPVAIWYEDGRPGGNVTINSPGGAPLGAMGTSREGHGVVYVGDGGGRPRVQVHGKGGVIVWDESDEQVAALLGNDGRGRVVLWNGGKRMAALEVDEGGSSAAVRVMSPSGKVVAGMLSRGEVGTVAVANENGQTVAEMTGSGRGAFQIFNGGPARAVLTLADNGGGLLQIKNNAGMGVASFTSAPGGGGYLQLLSASGTPTVEAGTLPNGNGTVRVGPQYKCFPVQAATPVMAVGLPDCIVGSQ